MSTAQFKRCYGASRVGIRTAVCQAPYGNTADAYAPGANPSAAGLQTGPAHLPLAMRDDHLPQGGCRAAQFNTPGVGNRYAWLVVQLGK